jgi:ATP-binding cassette subfamily F protein 3
LGVNGAGKSTLVKTLVGELPPMTGERTAHPDLEHRLLCPAHGGIAARGALRRSITCKRDCTPGHGDQEFRNFLGGWQFPGDRAFEVVDGFSGGEKRAPGAGP